LAPPLLLIVAVLGSILAGIATATEAAAVGAIGAMALAFARRRFDLEILRGVMRTTLEVTSMVFVILLGASVFSLVFRGLGGDVLAEHLLSRTPGGAGGALLAVMALMFVLGFFLDTFEILFIVVPIAAPVLLAMDIDPVWLGVMIGVNLQTSFLTPPFGFSLFYLRGVAPVSVRTADIFSGAVPFVGIQLLTLFLVWQAPPLATWLPDRIYHTPAVEAFGWTPGAGELKNIERIEIPNDENMPPYEFAPDFATLPLADVWPAGGQPETELP
jgi:tripartite ATP-independent transporter DctM subunit